MTREALLARTLVELADTLVDDFDVVDLLTRLADHCIEILDVDAAGIMLAAPDGQLRSMASSSETMRVLELFEVQAQEGPCLDSHRTGLPVVNQDLASADDRWPRFAAEALAAGFHSVHALPMRLRGSVIGALNLFRVRFRRDDTRRHRDRPSLRRRRDHRDPSTPRQARGPDPDQQSRHQQGHGRRTLDLTHALATAATTTSVVADRAAASPRLPRANGRR
jgi:transcriptional regulator with GAF, ATPase, and Fis domain